MRHEQLDVVVLASELQVYRMEHGNPIVPIEGESEFAFLDPALMEIVPWRATVSGDHELSGLWATRPTQHSPPDPQALFGIFTVGLDVLGVRLHGEQLATIARCIGHPVLGESLARRGE